MKKLNYFFIGLLGSVIAYSQSPSITWVKKIEGTYVEGKSIAVDVSGNVYTTGYSMFGADLDPGPSAFSIGAGAYISKIDVNGNFVWGGSLGNSAVGNAITIDAIGNMYITGYYTSSTSDADPGSGYLWLPYTSSGKDAFVTKLDPSGNLLWSKQLVGGSLLDDSGNDIAVDATGNVYITGSYDGYSSGDFDPGTGIYNLAGSGASDIFITKLDTNGDFVWAKKMGDASSDEGLSITLDVSGNIYTTGYFKETPDFDPGIGTYTLTAAGDRDIFVSKLDGNGNFVWAKRMGGSNFEMANDIKVDGLGNVYTTGYYNGTADFNPDAAVFNLTGLSGSYDIFISKLDANGGFVWAKSLGGNSTDKSFGICLDAVGNVYTSGFYSGSGDFDPGSSTYNLVTGSTTTNAFISKLTTTGNFVWAVSFDRAISATGVQNSQANAIALGANSDVHTTGIFEGITDFNPSPTSETSLSSGTSNSRSAFIHKMFQCSPLTASITSQVDVLCNSFATGEAVINASGGSSFTYSWSPSGGTSAAANGLVAGTYSCIVTNSCGNTATQMVIITQPTALTLNATANNTLVCSGNPSTLIASASGGSGTITYTWVAGPTNSVNIVSPITSSTYTINCSDANGCINTKTVSVSTNSLPIIIVNSGSICSGNNFTITPSGASSYTYSSGTAVVSPTTNTNYTITGTSAQGCVNSTPATSSVTVNALPNLTITSSNSLICAGQNAVLTANGANTYTWNNTAITNSITITPTITTNYSVTGTDINGCSNTTNYTQQASLCTGLTSITKDALNVYPNPFTDEIFIESNTNLKSIRLINTLGQTVLYQSINNVVDYNIHTDNFPKGIYYIELAGEQTTIKKIVKQ